MNKLADIEAFNKLHRDAVEKARQTNLDSDWNDAQSIEHAIKELQEVNRYYSEMAVRLGALEAFTSVMLRHHPELDLVNKFKFGWPDICKPLIDGSISDGGF